MRFLRDAKKRSFSPPLTPICRYVTEDKHERFRRMRRSSNLTRYEDERKEFSSYLLFLLNSVTLCAFSPALRIAISERIGESIRGKWKKGRVEVADRLRVRQSLLGNDFIRWNFLQELAVGQFSRYEKLTPDLRGVTRAGFTYLLANSFDRRDCFHPPFRSTPEIWRGIHLGWKITIDWTVRGTNPVNFNR